MSKALDDSYHNTAKYFAKSAEVIGALNTFKYARATVISGWIFNINALAIAAIILYKGIVSKNTITLSLSIVSIALVILLAIVSLIRWEYKVELPMTSEQGKAVLFSLPITIFIFNLFTLGIASAGLGLSIAKKIN